MLSFRIGGQYHGNFGARCHVPETEATIEGAGGEERPIGTERYAKKTVAVHRQSGDFTAGGDIKEAQASVVAVDGEQGAIRALDGTAPTDSAAAPGEEANPDQMLLGGHDGL